MFAAFVALASLLAFAGPLRAAEVGFGGSLTIPARDVLRMIRRQVAGSGVRLHNLGADPTTGFHVPDQSYLRIGARGPRQNFDLPHEPIRVGTNRAYAYLVNDIRTNDIGVTGVADRLRLTLRFEDDGAEFVGRCTTKPLGWYPARAFQWLRDQMRGGEPSTPPAMPSKVCAHWTGGALMPLLQWQSPSLTIDFVLSARNGQLELAVADPTVGGTVVPDGQCRLPQACDALRIATDLARRRVADRIKAHFDTPAFKAKVRAMLARAVHQQNRYAWMTRIASANFQNGAVVVSVVVDRIKIAQPRAFHLPNEGR